MQVLLGMLNSLRHALMDYLIYSATADREILTIGQAIALFISIFE